MRTVTVWVVVVIILIGATVALTCSAVGIWNELTGRWPRRRRTVPDVLAARLGSEDVYAEDRPKWVAMDFADIAATMPDLAALDRDLAELYLIPEES